MDTSTTSMLLNMGFSQVEIQAFEYIYCNGGKFTPSALQSYGYSCEQAKRLAYMNKVLLGDVQINSESDMITHVKKMTGASIYIGNGKVVEAKGTNYGVAYANVCPELMPSEERGEIGSIKPTGWHTVKYNGIVDGNYLYNRCHLIAYCLTAENANKKNLITGTRYLNNEGMLPYEIKVAQYVEDTGNHVLYRVTPVFEGNNLLASGALMEAYSVEDKGKGISFCIYAYNVQPGITINYKNGDGKLSGGANAGSGGSSGADTKKDL